MLSLFSTLMSVGDSGGLVIWKRLTSCGFGFALCISDGAHSCRSDARG